MSSISTDQGSLHYEVFGKGRPVILLHGYQGSWGLWQASMEFLASSYRTYAIDFWGFGESGARRSSYAVPDFVALVNQFMSQMGIASAPLVGHSMGGTVALLVAAMHPERAAKVVAISAPIVGSSLRFFPRIFGIPAVGWFMYHHRWLYRGFYHLFGGFYSRDRNWPRLMDRDVSLTTLEAFFASIGSLHRADLTPVLPQICVPVLGMYGKRDNVVDPGQFVALKKGLPSARIALYPQAGHFIMLDEPQPFNLQLKAFLDEPPVC